MVCTNPTEGCGTWQSPLATLRVGENLIESDEDKIASWVLTYALEGTDLHNVIAGRGAGALQLQRWVYGNHVYSVPNQPWYQEMRGWFGISLAKLQLQILSMAHPTSFLNPTGFVSFAVRPGVSPSDVENVCLRVLSREGDFTNLDFNAFVGTLTAFLIILVASEVALQFLRRRGDGPREEEVHLGQMTLSSPDSEANSSPPAPNGVVEPVSPLAPSIHPSTYTPSTTTPPGTTETVPSSLGPANIPANIPAVSSPT